MKNGLTTESKQLLHKYGLRPKKRFGQNFLIDERIIEAILKAAEVSPDDTVVEIGPGLGSLTEHLVQRAGQVLAVEIDTRLIPLLQEKFSAFPGFKLLARDILKVDLDQAVQETFARVKYPYKIVANLPYYITTPIIMKLLEERYSIGTMVLMVQKEVGERMQARPGTKAYGALSVAVQYYTEPSLVCKVPPGAFRPVPEVSSVVMKLAVRQVPVVTPQDERLFFQVVRAAFAQRRKTLLNALSGFFTNLSKGELTHLLKEAGIEPTVRGEELGLAEFAQIADVLARAAMESR